MVEGSMSGAYEKRDFFISFTKTDSDWAAWVAWVLEEEGFSVFFRTGISRVTLS